MSVSGIVAEVLGYPTVSNLDKCHIPFNDLSANEGYKQIVKIVNKIFLNKPINYGVACSLYSVTCSDTVIS